MNHRKTHTASARGQQPFKALLLASCVLFGLVPAAMAQGVHQYSFPESSGSSGHGTSTGGRVYGGTAVPTGRGPLDQYIPPAASSYYSRRHGRGATATYPSSHPFGTPQ